jgi:hypothetical protein
MSIILDFFFKLLHVLALLGTCSLSHAQLPAAVISRPYVYTFIVIVNGDLKSMDLVKLTKL